MVSRGVNAYHHAQPIVSGRSRRRVCHIAGILKYRSGGATTDATFVYHGVTLSLLDAVAFILGVRSLRISFPWTYVHANLARPCCPPHPFSDTGAGSLLWAQYFPCGELYGLELVKQNAETKGALRIKAIQGDQSDKAFLEGSFMQQVSPNKN